MLSTVYERLEPALRRTGLGDPIEEARLAYSFGLRNYLRRQRNVRVELGGSEAAFVQYFPDLKEVKRPIAGTLRKERAPLLDLIERTEPDDVFYDVGANLGIFACLVPAGTVVAFEPIAENVARLAENMALNDVSGHVVPVALDDESGLVELNRYDFRVVDLEYAVDEPGERRHPFDRYVPTMAGDEFVETTGLAPPDVLKIDVQGGEHDVLAGFSRLLDEHPPRVVNCEIHPEKLGAIGQSEDDVLAVFDDHGYTYEELRRGTATYTVTAVL